MQKKLLFLIAGIVLMTTSCQKDSNDYAPEEETNYPENFVTKATVVELLSGVTPYTRSGQKAVFSEISTADSYAGEDGLPSLYVINYKGGGFVILAADNRVEPILAYSMEGNFSMNFDDSPVSLWINEISNEIQLVRDAGEDQSEYYALQWEPEVLKSSLLHHSGIHDSDGIADQVEALTYAEGVCYCANDYVFPITTGYPISSSERWNQRTPFNQYIPDLCAAGCATIAMATVMHHHRYPGMYNYGDMDGYNGIAKLVYDCAIALNAQFGIQTATATEDIAPALKNVFGYRSATLTTNISATTIYSNLRNSRPVILRADSPPGSGVLKTGHAWVCDGYRSTTVCPLPYL